MIPGLDARGMLPTRNFSAGGFVGRQELLSSQVHVAGQNWGCYACSVRCKHNSRARGEVTEVRSVAGKTGEAVVEGPEYETVAAFGSNIGCSDPATTIAANQY